MYYITAYKRTAPVQGHVDPIQVINTLNDNKSHKVTFEVASPNMLTFVPQRQFHDVSRMLLAYKVPIQIGTPGTTRSQLIIGTTPEGLRQGIPLEHSHNHANKSQCYKTFRIPKRSGGVREIKAPIDALKKAQKAVYKYFSEDLHILEHECAYGFVKRRNCKASLNVHKANNSRWFLKLDFHNFFPSFDTQLLVQQLMCNANIAKFHANNLEDFLYLCTDENGKLVQGSPSSPYLANIAMISFDHAFSKYCAEHHLVYTRYADDMLISSAHAFDWRAIVNVVLETLNALGYTGLSLAADKTRYGNFNGANWNLGLMYNNQFDITVGHRNKRLFKVIAHKWDTLTPEEQVHWRGVFNYYKYIEPEYFTQERFNICWRD